MICSNCGNSTPNDSRVCECCGIPIANRSYEQMPKTKNKVFAYIGFGHGILSMVASNIPWICFMSIIYSIIGLLFSSYGFESNKVHIAKMGKIFSIVGLCNSVIVGIFTLIFKDVLNNI